MSMQTTISITRKDAKALGFVRYFTGKSCPKGHVAERFTSYGQCVDCITSSRDHWYENNKERAQAKNAVWHQNNPDAKRLRNAAWTARNKEQVRAGIKAHYYANPEQYAAYRKQWQEANPEKMGASKKKWKAANPHKMAADLARRAATKICATPAWADRGEIEKLYLLAAQLSVENGVAYEVDHVVPLRSDHVCGLHTHTNLAVILASANRTKSNRWWPDMPGVERHRCDIGMLA